MSIKIATTLYHADWCGYCKTFMPEWNTFTKNITGGALTIPGVKLSCETIEDTQLTKSGKKALIGGKPIKGYPTVKITVTSGATSKEIEYQGKRNSTELISFMKILADRERSGPA